MKSQKTQHLNRGIALFFNDVVGSQCAKAVDLFSAASEGRFQKRGFGARFGGGLIGNAKRVALHDAAAKKSLAGGDGQGMQAHGHSAGTLSEKGNLIRIAAEMTDIVAYPLKCQLLVLHSIVSFQFVNARQKPKRPQTIVEGNHHQIFCRGQPGAVVNGH